MMMLMMMRMMGRLSHKPTFSFRKMNLCIDKSKMMLEKTSLTIQPHLPLVYNIPLAGMFFTSNTIQFFKNVSNS